MPASVAHSTGPPGATKCFNCQQIGHYKANCPQRLGPKTAIPTKTVVTNPAPSQDAMAKLFANMMLTFFAALAGSQPSTPSSQAPPLPMRTESTTALQSLVKSLENANAEQAERISHLTLRIAELTETVSALSNQIPMLSAPSSATEKKVETKLATSLSLQPVSDAKLINIMPNSHTIKKEPESKQETKNEPATEDSKKEPIPPVKHENTDKKRYLRTLPWEITMLRKWQAQCMKRLDNPPNSYIERELITRATALETLCVDYELFLNTYPPGPTRLKAVEAYDASHPWSVPAVRTNGLRFYDVNLLRESRYTNKSCHPLDEF